jgi:hypothetical protein
MKRTLAVLAALAAIASVTACKSTSTTASPAAPGTTAAAPATATASASVAASAAPSAAPATTAAATGAPDPCKLITATDVKSALGRSGGTPQSFAVGLYRQCLYPAGPVIEVRNIDKATFDQSAVKNPGPVTPLSGVGQGAYTAKGDLLVWQNGTEIVIAFPNGGGSLAIEKQLALAAIGRL